MSQLREKYTGALNVLQTFPAALIRYAIEDIKKYVNGLEEVRRLDNQIITNLHNEIVELKQQLSEVQR